MKVNSGHLSYCTNIHPGKNWTEDFEALKLNLPLIKESVSPDQQMGLGLRLSNEASLALSQPAELAEFMQWLKDNNAYVFTMNGFPYGEFHRTVVKADVHTPGWITESRRDYTIRLFHILKELLPDGIDGGISTNPLGYRHWYTTKDTLKDAREKGTLHVIEVISELIRIYNETGKVLHLDIEPEPDGMMETGREFIDWFEGDLLSLGIPVISEVWTSTSHKLPVLTKTTGAFGEHITHCRYSTPQAPASTFEIPHDYTQIHPPAAPSVPNPSIKVPSI